MSQELDYAKYQTLSLEHLQSLGYDVEELYPQLFWVKDFLTQKEIDDVFEVINSTPEEVWTHHYMEGIEMLAKQKYNRTDVDKMIEEGLIEITEGWADKTLSFVNAPIRNELNDKLSQVFEELPEVNPKGVGTIQRQYEGVPLHEHIDSHSDPSLIYAAVMYLNDDYTDGELYFSHLGLEFKPHAGSLMIFATGPEYIHGVRAPGKGPLRYVLPCFIGKTDFYKYKLD